MNEEYPKLTPEELEKFSKNDTSTSGSQSKRKSKKLLWSVVLVALLAALFVRFYLNPEHAKHIPQDSSVIVSVQPTKLKLKVNYNKRLEDPRVKEFLQGIDEEGLPFADWIREPQNLGLNFLKPVYFAAMLKPGNSLWDTTPTGRFTMVAAVNNKEKLESNLNTVWETAESDEKDNYEGFQLLTFEDSLCIAYSGDALILMAQDSGDSIQHAMKKAIDQEKIPDLEKIEKFTKDISDMAFWTDSKQLMSIYPLPEEALSELPSTIGLAGITFKKGSVVIKGTTHYEDDILGSMGGGGVDVALLESIPAKPILAGAISFDTKKLTKHILNDYVPYLEASTGMPRGELLGAFQMGLGISLRNVLSIFGGDIVFALGDIKNPEQNNMYEEPEISAVLTATIGNEDKWKDVYNLIEMGGKEIMETSLGVTLFDRKKQLFLCTDDLTDQLKSKGKFKKSAGGKIKATLKGHDNALYIDIERIAEVLQTTQEAPEELIDSLSLFKSMTFFSDGKGNKTVSAMTIEMTDSKNSLETITDMLISLFFPEDGENIFVENRDKANVSEAIACISGVNTACRLYEVEAGRSPKTFLDVTKTGHFYTSDMDGTFFEKDSYSDIKIGDMGNGKAGVLSVTVKNLDSGKTYRLKWDKTNRRYTTDSATRKKSKGSLFSANRGKAVSAEIFACMSGINTACRLYEVETGRAPETLSDLTKQGYFDTDWMNGSYFQQDSYSDLEIGDQGNGRAGVVSVRATLDDGEVYHLRWSSMTRTYERQ